MLYLCYKKNCKTELKVARPYNDNYNNIYLSLMKISCGCNVNKEFVVGTLGNIMFIRYYRP